MRKSFLRNEDALHGRCEDQQFAIKSAGHPVNYVKHADGTARKNSKSFSKCSVHMRLPSTPRVHVNKGLETEIHAKPGRGAGEQQRDVLQRAENGAVM